MFYAHAGIDCTSEFCGKLLCSVPVCLPALTFGGTESTRANTHTCSLNSWQIVRGRAL